MSEVTERQKRFVDFYIETGNATEAARKAGYKKPHVQGTQNLAKLSVKEAIDARLAEMESERIADATEVLEHLTAALRGEIKEQVIVTESIGDFMSEARIMEKQLSAKDRLKAAELLAKRYGLLVDKKEITGANGGPLTFAWEDDPDA